MKERVVYLNGALVPESQAVISVFDRGVQYGDAVYTGNLILSQTALDKNDLAAARRYLLRAAATPGARSIEQNGLDTSVARVFLQRGERDAVLDYFNQTRHLWPQGSQLITRWEDIIRSGRIPNFNNRGPLGIN